MRRRYGVALGYDPALVGMSEMFVDVESDSQEAWKILYIYVAGPAHGLVGCYSQFSVCKHHVDAARTRHVSVEDSEFNSRESFDWLTPDLMMERLCQQQLPVQGIGKLLLHRCLAHVPPGGVVKLRSAPSAVAFYQRFGFRVRHLSSNAGQSSRDTIRQSR